ncbi:MAG: hypothetical protein LBJ32_02350 [Oscillospiraceae bacterium]|nr:hypothetical protein [Oscillospiraceae bacterium]
MKFIVKKIFSSEKNQIFDCNEAEYIIRSFATSLAWPDSKKQSNLVCCYSSNEKEIKKIIEIAANDFNFIKFVKDKDLKNSSLI